VIIVDQASRDLRLDYSRQCSRATKQDVAVRQYELDGVERFASVAKHESSPSAAADVEGW
jgi:hypothetical protein